VSGATGAARERSAPVDLRTDTLTKPTAGMRAAMAAAEVGDEQRGEDPTLLELERRAAAFLGQEAAIFVPTATMANQIAIRLQARPGDELIAEQHSHLLVYEQGATSALAGVVTRGLAGEEGRLSPEQVRAAICRPSNHVSATRLLVIENTHNASGGRVWPLDELDAVVETCRDLDVGFHLDGARLVNAAIALGVEPARIGRCADTVTLCLSKGLGCPVGAILAGSEQMMEAARRAKHLLGGAMRQTGIVAAAGLYALDHNVARTADDHARAHSFAAHLAAAGLPVDLAQVETNFVLLDVGAIATTAADALQRLADNGVLLSRSLLPGVLRAVVHLDITDEAITAAAHATVAAFDEIRRTTDGCPSREETP
jgi:threonine aldolase